ncbi:sensor histidine kinase [Nocardioides rubriscoriae]|uniref:sensor histidine kinase n=1 Tax=Nocardioides rubriscoriae TaxID=642762 RepID=UPI001FE39B13|nr:histidine kinase [Nocardioides rubriscoriae]
MPDSGRPSPDAYQPPLRWWSHAWRLVAMALVVGVVWGTIGAQRSTAEVVLDLALGTAALVLVHLRRRAPLAVALVTAVLSSLSATASGPAILAGVSLATGRRWVQVVAVGAVNFAAGTVFSAVYPPSDPQPWWVTAVTNLVFTSAMLAWGMYIGSRRELLWTLRARAERAEAEQELRADRSRLEERGRIAREMHDVLAHRISQISMRAGALGYRTDLSADELREGVAVIRDAANDALTDLRGVLGVLRGGPDGADGADGSDHAPQPTYADLGELVGEARRDGVRVAFCDAIVDAPVPEATGRTLYRIVQEGITNARKHAPGAELSIDVHGSPEDGIGVVLANPLGFGPTATPGSGLGLVGLAERAALRGGRIEHGTHQGSFVLRGWIPWTA